MVCSTRSTTPCRRFPLAVSPPPTQSLAKWKQPAVHWTAVVVMILGSLPFALYVATLRGHRKALIKDQQVRGLLSLLLVTCC